MTHVPGELFLPEIFLALEMRAAMAGGRPAPALVAGAECGNLAGDEGRAAKLRPRLGGRRVDGH